MTVVFSGARVSFGALCLVAMAGCGGRTSTFTPEDPSLGSSEPAGGSTGVSGSSSSTTHPTTPSGGASSTPAAGAPSVGVSMGVAGGATAGGSSGVAGAPSTGGAAGTTSAAVNACTKFCFQAVNNCPGEVGSYPDCVNSCTSQLSASEACLVLGQALISCFSPYFQPQGCSNLDIAETACGRQQQDLQQCMGSVSPAPVPVPTPVPVPIPEPASNCKSLGSSSPVTCDLTSNCNDGSFYTVNCKQVSPTQSICSCQSGNGTGQGIGTGFTLNESVAFACYDGISTCGGPATPPPQR